MKWLQLVYILKSNETRIARMIHNLRSNVYALLALMFNLRSNVYISSLLMLQLRSNRSTELNKWGRGVKNTRLDADITLVAYPNAFRVKGMEKYAS